MKNCYCGQKESFEKCCQPILEGKTDAPTAVALMRARYSAFATQNIDFIASSYLPEKKEEFDEKETTIWAQNATWKGLEILETQRGEKGDPEGTVEFIANYNIGGASFQHHEVADFKFDKKWYFVDGQTIPHPIQRSHEKVGRNDPCLCKSGKKYKKCCLPKERELKAAL